MKVINTWDSPEEPTMNSRCADCNCEDCRCDRPPMPAAGAWRTDVENAPRDGSEFLIWYETEDNGHQIRIVSWYEPFKNFRDRMDYGIWPPAFKAFVTINPPETTNDHP